METTLNNIDSEVRSMTLLLLWTKNRRFCCVKICGHSLTNLLRLRWAASRPQVNTINRVISFSPSNPSLYFSRNKNVGKIPTGPSSAEALDTGHMRNSTGGLHGTEITSIPIPASMSGAPIVAGGHDPPLLEQRGRDVIWG